MTRGAHTPGPWRVEHTPYRHVRASDGTQDGWGSTVFAADYSREADERLIASAPALLEALENFCSAAEYWAGCDEGCDPDTTSSEIMSSGGAWPAEAYDTARAAINLARGAQ